MKAVFIDLIFDEIFLVKGKSEILKYFFPYGVIYTYKWNTSVISSDPPFIEMFETFIYPSYLKQEMRESLL